jgi:hypothetical protein
MLRHIKSTVKKDGQRSGVHPAWHPHVTALGDTEVLISGGIPVEQWDILFQNIGAPPVIIRPLWHPSLLFYPPAPALWPCLFPAP